MLRALFLRARPGRVYDGPVAYLDGNGEGDPKHGYYALADDGKKLRRPLVRLVAVTGGDGSHHYEVCRKRDPHQRPFPGAIVYPERAVELEFKAEGVGSLEIVRPDEPIARCLVCNGRVAEGVCTACGAPA